MKLLISILFMCGFLSASCYRQEQPVKAVLQVHMPVHETTIATMPENLAEAQQANERMLTEAAEKRQKEYEKANTPKSKSAAAQTR